MSVGFLDRQSGRGDLNPGPHGPDPCALAELRYAPNGPYYTSFGTFDKLCLDTEVLLR